VLLFRKETGKQRPFVNRASSQTTSRSAVFVNSWPYSASNNVRHSRRTMQKQSDRDECALLDGLILYSPLRELALFLSTINKCTAAYSIYLFYRSL